MVIMCSGVGDSARVGVVVPNVLVVVTRPILRVLLDRRRRRRVGAAPLCHLVLPVLFDSLLFVQPCPLFVIRSQMFEFEF